MGELTADGSEFPQWNWYIALAKPVGIVKIDKIKALCIVYIPNNDLRVILMWDVMKKRIAQRPRKTDPPPINKIRLRNKKLTVRKTPH